MTEDDRAGDLEGGNGESGDEFGELLKYTLVGFGGGFLLGAALDKLGYRLSAIGQWLVRTLSGEGETLLEGVYALRRRLAGGPKTLAQAYGWGKLAGLAVPWLVDWGSRLFGVDVYGVESFYIPFFYAMSDQIGANVSGFLYMRRREPTLRAAWARYIRNPVMTASLMVILAAPAGLLAARLLGFAPTSQVRTAAETIAANLCWIPPLVGWLKERKDKAAGGPEQKET